MEVSTELFNHIAKLAKLKFAVEEKEKIRIEMQNMIAFVNKLNELDTSGVEPLIHISQVIQIPRADIASNSNSKNDILLNAPQTDGNYFLVPKVIENPNQ